MRPDGVHPIYWPSEKYQPPTDWSIQPIKAYATVVKGKMPRLLLKEPTENSLPYLLIDGLGEGDSLYTEETHLPIINEEDTAVVADGSRSGLAIRGVHGVLGSTLLAYRAKKGFDPDYLFYVLQSLYPYTNTATIGGAIPHLDKRLLAKLKLATPHFDEQRRIAAAIKLADEAIAKARAELEAAQEFKRSLSHDLLARGSSSSFFGGQISNARFAHWKPTTFGTLVHEKIRNGYSPVCPQDATGKCVLSLGALDDEGFNPDGVKPAPLDDDGLLPFRLEPDDILVSRSNTPELVGRVGRYTGEPEIAFYPDLMMRIRVDKTLILPAFAELILRSGKARQWFKSRASGTSGSMVKIKRRDIMSLSVALPLLDEQAEIVSLIEAASQVVDTAENKIRVLCDLKKSLLQNLLTGKLRLPPE